MLIIMAGEVLLILDMAFHYLPESLALLMSMSAFIGFTFMLFVVALIYDLTISVSRQVPFDQERRRTIKVIFDTGGTAGRKLVPLAGHFPGKKITKYFEAESMPVS